VRRRERELNKLYEKIAREFPFLVQQGLYTPRGEKVRIYKSEDYYKYFFTQFLILLSKRRFHKPSFVGPSIIFLKFFSQLFVNYFLSNENINLSNENINLSNEKMKTGASREIILQKYFI
jgi:hypothetical protein